MRNNLPLTKARLDEVLDYDPIAGRLTWKTGRYAGQQAGTGRRPAVHVDGVKYSASRLVWFFSYGTWPQSHIAFKNGSADDLRISNLRLKVLPHALTAKSWYSMHTRCYSPGFIGYESYGEKGITVCQRWHDYDNFVADMGPRPSRDHSIDRIDNDGNYEPDNCRWATMTEQARNRSHNNYVTAFGKTQCITAWAAEVGLRPCVIGARLRLGWSPVKALTTPVRKWRKSDDPQSFKT